MASELKMLDKTFNNIKKELRTTCLEIDNSYSTTFKYMKDLLLYCKEIVMLMQYRRHIQKRQQEIQRCYLNGHFYKELAEGK